MIAPATTVPVRPQQPSQSSPPQQRPQSTQSKSSSDLLKSVSASRLTTFHQCRLKFFFRYVLGLKKPKSSAQFVGSTVHLVLRAWSRARWKKESFGEDYAREVFAQTWVEDQKLDPIQWEEPEEKEMETGWRLLQMYFKETPIKPDEKPEAVEVAAEADLRKHGLTTLIGIMDLVRAGGRIVDFKTAGQTPNPERAIHLHETQLSCYAVLYRDATGRLESGVELHHLIKLKTPKLVVTSAPPMTNAQETRLFKTMESYLNGVQRQDWIPNPNPMTCACCEFFQECRRWS